MSTEIHPRKGVLTAEQQASKAKGWAFSGDLGQLPVVAALIFIGVYFQINSGGLFLSSRNLSNITLQIAQISTIALAAVFVLLLGEIDLSLAAVANLTGAIMAELSAVHGYSWWASIAIGLGVALLIGVINGFLVAVVRIPSFIVTLAGFIGYSGLLLHVLLPNVTIRIIDPTILGISQDYVDTTIGIGVPIVALVLFAVYTLNDRFVKAKKGLPVPSYLETGLTIGIAAVVVILIVSIFENYLGVPKVMFIVIGTIGFSWLVLKFTTFGRHVYAVGGNAEAARRAGINVTMVRICMFAATSLIAGLSGILESSREISAASAVSPSLLLNAIAAAVIGGVSLFGGRGSVWSVLLGALLIGGLINGLTLQSQGSDIQMMIEGLVLIVAVILDAVIRRNNAVSGR